MQLFIAKKKQIQKTFQVASSTPKDELTSIMASHTKFNCLAGKENNYPSRRSLSRRGTAEFLKPGIPISGNSKSTDSGKNSKPSPVIPMGNSNKLNSNNNSSSNNNNNNSAPQTPAKEDLELDEELSIFTTRYLVTPCNIPVSKKRRELENENSGRAAGQSYGSKRSRTRRGQK